MAVPQPQTKERKKTRINPPSSMSQLSGVYCMIPMLKAEAIFQLILSTGPELLQGSGFIVGFYWALKDSE